MLEITPVGTGDWMRLGMYAFPGGGKSSLIGTGAESGQRTLIVHSSMDLMPSRIIGLPGIEQVTCDRWEQMLEVSEAFMYGGLDYDWVWWDCASIAQDALLDDVWAGTVAEKPARAYLIDKATGKPGKPNTTPASGLDKGEYGRNMERIGQWVRNMIGCNSFHFGVTFHPMEGQHPTNDEGGTLMRPFVQGKNMTEKICGYMNMVAFIEVMENQEKELTWRRMHVKESPRYYAKDQYDAFLPKGYIDNPTIPKIMTAVEKARGRALGKGIMARRGTAPATSQATRRRGASNKGA